MYKLSYDPAKRLKALFERDVDFEDAAEVFEGRVIEWEDTRFDYGKTGSCVSVISAVGPL